MVLPPRPRLALLATAALGAGFARLGAESSWLVALLRYGPPWAPLVPLAVVVLASAWDRAWRWALFAAGALVAAALWLVPIGLGSPRPAAGPTWTLAAWNVEKLDHGASAVAAELRALDVDVMCLSEAGDYFWHTDPDQQPAQLELALADYRVVTSGELRVLSRLPVLAETVHTLSHGEPRRPVLEVTVATPTPVHVFCMHAPPSYVLQRASDWASWSAERRAHAAEVLGFVVGVEPALLAGDFNCPEASSLWRSAPLQDAWSEVGRGFGWTTALGSRLDRVLVTESVGLRRLDVVRMHASDHDALLATFERR